MTAIEAPGWWDREVFLKGEAFHGICNFCCYGVLVLVVFFSPGTRVSKHHKLRSHALWQSHRAAFLSTLLAYFI